LRKPVFGCNTLSAYAKCGLLSHFSKMTHTDQDTSPFVSIVILYYKRCEIIERTLRSAISQDYTNREIIVVDNHSQDDLRAIVQDLGAEIRLIELPENKGACAGRNAEIRAARGNIVVFIDDDVCFASPFEVSKVVHTFIQRADIDVLALQICDPHTGAVRIREWCHTRPYREYANREFETTFFGEGGCAFRREVFDRCGLYYEPFFYGAEGHDMVVRLLDSGCRILYTPEIRVTHWASEIGRTASRQFYFYTRNFIWMSYKDYRLWDGLRFVIPKMLMMFYFAVRTAGYWPVLRGLWDGLTGLKAIRPDRTPITRATVQRIAEDERWRPGLIARLARHRTAPQI
jgi:glycosyltransferase involved in cell wall biosynthesis